MKEIIVVFIGGGLGSIVRFVLGRWITSLHTYYFPFGTLVVNVIACLALGVVVGLADHRQIISQTSRLFWVVGFCGGFSTFSTFSNETLSMLQNGFHFSWIAYIISSLVLCVGATVVGILLGENIF